MVTFYLVFIDGFKHNFASLLVKLISFLYLAHGRFFKALKSV